jgi:hypothetical protein
MDNLDKIMLKYIHLNINDFNVYANEDIIWVFYQDYWALNLHRGFLISYNINFFGSLKNMFLIDDEKLNKIVYLYGMNLLKFNGPIEITCESYSWAATLEGMNRLIEEGRITTTKITDYETKFS